MKVIFIYYNYCRSILLMPQQALYAGIQDNLHKYQRDSVTKFFFGFFMNRLPRAADYTFAIFRFFGNLRRQFPTRLKYIVIESFFIICLSRLGRGFHSKIEFYHFGQCYADMVCQCFFFNQESRKIGTQENRDTVSLRVLI
jgi:hypothetical protein